MPIFKEKEFEKQKSNLLLDSFSIEEKDNELTKETPCQASIHEIYYIIKGKGVFNVDENVIEFKPGTILFVSPGRWRHWDKIEGDLNALVVMFDEEFISDYFHDYLFLYRFHYFYNDDKPFHLNITKNQKDGVDHIFNKIKEEVENLRKDSKHFLRAYTYYLLCFLNRIYKEVLDLESEMVDTLLASQFRQLLQSEIDNLSTAKEYAEKLKISVSKLNKITKSAFGKNAAKMIRERRIAEAKRLILFTTEDISQICYKLKFSEPSNFNRVFKKETGKTPAKFRDEHFINY